MPDHSVPSALEAIEVTKRFRRRTALADCSVTVPQGSVIGLVGPNGAGKSTLLQLACGLVQPTEGRLRVVGSEPAADAAHLARVGFVAQDAPVYRSMTVRDHLALGRRMNPRWDHDLAEARMAQLGIDLRQKAGALSGGQRAQLALTVAASKRPELLMLDEPASALDPVSRRALMDDLTEFVSELGATAVLSSHLLEDVERVCDFLIVLVGGRIRLSGSVVDLLAHHRRHAPREELRREHGAAVIAEDPGGVVVRHSQPPDDNVQSSGQPVSLGELVLAYMTTALNERPVGNSQIGGAR